MRVLLILGISLAAVTMSGCSNENKSAEETAPVSEVKQNSIDSNTAAAAPAAPDLTRLPSFNLMDENGGTVNLQGLRNKKLFVNLWATWCPPCRREMPSIKKLYQSVDTSKVAFVMISLDDQFDKAKKYVQDQKLKLPVYYPAESLPPLFNVEGIPATFIFDEKGSLIKRIDGSADYDTKEYREMLK